MSGPFGSSQWMYASGGFYPYQIEQSLRFNDDDSAYLSRTPASAGNRKTWTWSGWVKRGNFGGTHTLFAARNSVADWQALRISSGDQLEFLQETVVPTFRRTTAVYRDPSSWYHIVLSVDTTQATAQDRIKIYVNGVEVTDWSNNQTVGQNTDFAINNTVSHTIGRDADGVSYLDGYMAEVNFIDGTALDPTSFGETKSGIWVAKEYTGSYGTNGFYLSFADSSAIGDDLSGNGNDWTANNLVSTDVLLDSPTNNFATINPLSKFATGATLSDGNLRGSLGSSAGNSKPTFAPSSGKWYAEFTISAISATSQQLVLSSTSADFAPTSIATLYASNGQTYDYNAASYVAYGDAWAANDVIGVAWDLDAVEVTFYRNGVSQGTLSAPVVAIGTGQTTAFVVSNSSAGTVTYVANFGQAPFAYTPPSGFVKLNTANLPDPAIDPAQDDVPADYFNTIIWSGDGTSPRTLTGVGFQPDLVWGKVRNYTYDHLLYDAVRGAGITKGIGSSNTAAEGGMGDNATNGYISAFAADGFSVVGSGNPGYWNSSGENYVAWNWLAGNGTSSNTDGSITSTVSVNQKAGFSVVGYTGTGANATVGHGLGVAPKMIIFKNRTDVEDWLVYTSEFGYQYDIFLDLTNAIRLLDIYYQGDPTSTTFSLKNQNRVNGSGDEHIAYCFAEVEGYSKFGSYVGNSSTDGPFVYCGFRPAFVMIKRTDAAANWGITDDARSPYNVGDQWLFANLSDAEYAGTLGANIDLLSSGFKMRIAGGTGFNTSGGTYIFMAFAESPFKYANAR